MKKFFILFLLFIFPISANPFISILSGSVSSGGGGSPTYDFIEKFETATTGYENTGWTTYGSGNPAANSGTMGFTAGQGSQSLYAPAGGLNGAYRANALTGEQWLFFKMYCVSGVVDDWNVYGDAGETGLRIGFGGGGKISLRVGDTTLTDTSTFPLNQWVGIWVRYKPGTGNAEGDLYYATSPFTKPGSPTLSISGATSTPQLDRPWFISRSTYAIAWDNIIFNQTSIGDNPGGTTSYTLVYDSSVSGGSAVNGSTSDVSYYVGHTEFNIGGSSIGAIGKVSFRLTSVGNLTGKTFVVKFWTSNGSHDCVAVQATSDDVSGTSWTDENVEFVFSTPWTPSTSTDYNITVAEKSGTADVSNYIQCHYTSSGNTSGGVTDPPGYNAYGWWGPNSGSPGQFANVQSSFIQCIKIWTTP